MIGVQSYDFLSFQRPRARCRIMAFTASMAATDHHGGQLHRGSGLGVELRHHSIIFRLQKIHRLM